MKCIELDKKLFHCKIRVYIYIFSVAGVNDICKCMYGIKLSDNSYL